MAEETQTVENNPNGLNKESLKIKKSYDTAMGNLVSIFKGENNLAETKKIPNGDVITLMEEVLKEEVDAKKEDFKLKAKGLIKAKVNYDRFILEKEREFQKIKDGKTKEFTRQANDLVNIVASISTLKEEYLTSLVGS